MSFEGRFSLPAGAGRLIEGVRLALQFVLIVLLAVIAARIGWLIIAPNDAVSTLTPRPLPSPIQQTTRADVRGDLSLLMTTNPFEASGRPADAVPDAPETTLNLRLVAIFMSTDPSADSASIVTPDNQTVRVQPGEEFLPGVSLVRVLSDRVIISRDGNEETLMRGGREAGLSVISDAGEARDAPSTVEAPGSAMFSPGFSARTLLASLTPSAEMRDGVVEAFVLSPRSNPQLMRDAGLEPGDRLVRVNNQRVADFDAAALAAELGSSETVSVTVLRGGQARTFDIRFEEG